MGIKIIQERGSGQLLNYLISVTSHAPHAVQDTNVEFMVLDRGDSEQSLGTASPPFAKGQAFIVSVLDSILSLVKREILPYYTC